MVSKPNSEYADVTDMFRRLTTLDQESIEYRRQRDVIVERCLPLADHIARRFSNRGEPFEDLVQVARVGLINAVNRFDADKGAQFLAFAVPTILGEVRRYFRDHSWSVKVPRGLKELSSQLKRAREELSQQVGRAPTATEIARHLGIDREEVVQAQIASSAYSTWSSDAPVSGDDGDGRSVSDSFGSLRRQSGEGGRHRNRSPTVGGVARTRADGSDASLLREHDPDPDRGTPRDIADARVTFADSISDQSAGSSTTARAGLSGEAALTHQIGPRAPVALGRSARGSTFDA